MPLTSHAREWYRMVAAQAISVKVDISPAMIKPVAFFHWKIHIRRLKITLNPMDIDHKYLTDSESLSLNIEATCLLLSSPRNFPYEIKMDKYRPYPSMISMFTSDSQHPPRSRHAVHLGDIWTRGFSIQLLKVGRKDGWQRWTKTDHTF